MFPADAVRGDLIERVAHAEACTVSAWVLLPNHFHLVVRTGGHPLTRSLRWHLTG